MPPKAAPKAAARRYNVNDITEFNRASDERFGLLPVACYTCGRRIGHLEEPMREWLEAGGTLEDFYDIQAMPEAQQERFSTWIDIETPQGLAWIKGVKERLHKKALMDAFIKKHPKVDWGYIGRDPNHPYPSTEEMFRSWNQAFPRSLELIMQYVSEFWDNGVLRKAFDELKIPYSNARLIIGHVVFGNGAAGFRRSLGASAYSELPECCRANLRPPPKIF